MKGNNMLSAYLDGLQAKVNALPARSSGRLLSAGGEDFSGESVRVLKEKEVKQFGEDRTSRLVLEAWDGMKG